MSFFKNFDQVTKHNFDQTPKLLETFDQVIRSSEIRSSDPLSKKIKFRSRKLCPTTPEAATVSGSSIKNCFQQNKEV